MLCNLWLAGHQHLAARDAYVTVAGQKVWVHQATACRVGISPITFEVPANPSSPLSIPVNISSTCSWEAVANDRWLSVSPTRCWN